MTTMKLPPANIMAALGIVGALWFYARSAKAAGTTSANNGTRVLIKPSTPAASVGQQARDAAKNASLFNAPVLGSFFTAISSLKPSIINSDARKAVRAGDPYYGNPDSAPAFGGVTPGFNSDMTEARNAVRAGDNYYNAPPLGDDASAAPVYTGQDDTAAINGLW